MLNAQPTPSRPHATVAFVALSRQLMVNGLQEGTVAAGTPKKLSTRACSTVPGGRAAAQVSTAAQVLLARWRDCAATQQTLTPVSALVPEVKTSNATRLHRTRWQCGGSQKFDFSLSTVATWHSTPVTQGRRGRARPPGQPPGGLGETGPPAAAGRSRGCGRQRPWPSRLPSLTPLRRRSRTQV